MTDIDAGASRRLAERLLPGETLIWMGSPAPGLILTGRDAMKIPFSLLWGGFAIFWEVQAFKSGAPPAFILFGSAFAAIGLFLIVGRFFADAWLRARTSYAITDCRVLIARSEPWPSFKALRLATIAETTLTEERYSRGTIRFGPATTSWQSNSSFAAWIPALDPVPQFISIDNATRVFALLETAAAKVLPERQDVSRMDLGGLVP